MPDFMCALCGMTFSRPDYLTRHMRITHTVEGRFECAVCGHTYDRNPQLIQHMRITHTGEGRFQCGMCGRRYYVCEHLAQHMRFSHFDRPSGAQATTHTQHTESSHGIRNTVSTVTSSLGTAIVTTVQSATSLVATTTVSSRASGTVTVTHPSVEPKRDYDNECPICFESLNDGETITTPYCKAKFHVACLRKLDQTSPGVVFPCPNCRRILTREWLSGNSRELSGNSREIIDINLERDYGNECSICLNSLNDGETITTRCCDHRFHTACLQVLSRMSLDRGFPCPICRRMLTHEWLLSR